MISLRAMLAVGVCSTIVSYAVQAQQDDAVVLTKGNAVYERATGQWTATNVTIKYRGTVLTAEKASWSKATGEVVADGDVRILQNDMVWVGDHIQYNYRDRQIAAQEFRTGKAPTFAAGRELSADLTNGVYNATHALITTDDISEPAVKIRARRLRIVPGERVEAWDGMLYLGDVPVFYFPYYSRNLGERSNNFNFVPGYRSSYGPFVLGTYTWFLNPQLDGELHLDYRERRGVGAGPDFNFHLGRWGNGSLSYYYAHDEDPSTNAIRLISPSSTNFLNAPFRENRQRVAFSYQAQPFTNLEVRSLVRYQNDPGVVRDFFTGEYRENPQPGTFFEADKFWRNFSLDVYAQPRVNDFYETVERLPEVRLTGFQQQVANSALFYESETSAGYYRRLFADTSTNSPGGLTDAFTGRNNFYAVRGDTYHQVTLPRTFFGWLNFTPRAGGRITYYGEANGPGGNTDETIRKVFNTGAEISFKASRLWPGARSQALDVDGLRHIIEPSVNYVYVPTPNRGTNQLPQFDYQIPSLRLLPVEYPEYNAIDSIDSQNVLRFGLRNKVQTKRNGRVDDLLSWEVVTDWRLRPRANQQTFADLYSDLSLKPRAWIRLESQTRLNLSNGDWRMLLHTLTLEPNDTWSWTIGHLYLAGESANTPVREQTGLGLGENILTSSLFYRVSENWGFRALHHFDVEDGRMQEQFYTLYRDLRSWTVALTGGLRDSGVGPTDFSIAFTFSLKAAPRYGLGKDTVRPYALLGH